MTFQGHLGIVGSPRVEVGATRLEIHDHIQFESGKATIRPASFGLMNEIADVIAHHPHIKKIQIEGHASAEGDAQFNKALSVDRANAVRDYLIGRGIPAGELTAIGFGTEEPIGDDTTVAGREQNRRVEFTIIERDAASASGKGGAL